MRRVQPDMPRFGVAVENHRDLPLRRHDEQSPAEQHVEARNAGSRARGTRGERELAREHFVVVLFHHVFGPLLQIGVADVPDALGRLPSPVSRFVVRKVGMTRVLADRLWRAGNRKQGADADTDPGGLGSGREIGRGVGRHRPWSRQCPREGCRYRQQKQLPHFVRFPHSLLRSLPRPLLGLQSQGDLRTTH